MYLQLEELNKDIVTNPYPTIINSAEQRLKHVGKKVFPVLSLMPVSLVAPNMPYQDKFIRSNIHALVLGASGSSKSTLVNELFGEITPNPLFFNKISPPELVEEMFEMTNMRKSISALCPDIEEAFHNPSLMKILEGFCGEEQRIDARNMRRNRQFSVNGIFLGAGLPQSITKYASYGMLRRVSPVVMFHTQEEKDEINQHIKNSMFVRGTVMSFEDIKKFYMKIYQIQNGKDKYHPKIDGYIVDGQFREGIYDVHNEWSKPFSEDKYLITELHSGYRYLCNHAMLNMFNRKIEKDGKKHNIVIDSKDYDVAIVLMELEMRMKYKIYKSNRAVKMTDDIFGLYQAIINDDRMDSELKNISRIFLESKMKTNMARKGQSG